MQGGTPLNVGGCRVPRTSERGLFAIPQACGKADDKGDVVACERLLFHELLSPLLSFAARSFIMGVPCGNLSQDKTLHCSSES